MTQLGQALGRIAVELSNNNCRVALVGGLAVSVRAEPRMTRDADFAVAVNSDRPNDADDLRALAQVAEQADWDQAATAVALIETRGFNRDRDLSGALQVLRARGPY